MKNIFDPRAPFEFNCSSVGPPLLPPRSLPLARPTSESDIAQWKESYIINLLQSLYVRITMIRNEFHREPMVKCDEKVQTERERERE